MSLWSTHVDVYRIRLHDDNSGIKLKNILHRMAMPSQPKDSDCHVLTQQIIDPDFHAVPFDPEFDDSTKISQLKQTYGHNYTDYQLKLMAIESR